MKGKIILVLTLLVLILGALVFFRGFNLAQDEFDLQVGESIMRDGVTMKFVSITEDSRCPQGMQCVHGGIVGVQLELERDGQTSTASFAGLPPTHEFEGKVIEIVEVSPPRREGRTIEQDEYVITIVVRDKEALPQQPDGEGEVLEEQVVMTSSGTETCEEVPQFKDYPVAREDIFIQEVSDPLFTNSEDDDFVDAIETAAREGVNFAGKFIIAQWECEGDNCDKKAVIDAASGAFVSMGLLTTHGLEFVSDSYLLIINPPLYIPYDNEVTNSIVSEYFKFDPLSGGLERICQFVHDIEEPEEDF